MILFNLPNFLRAKESQKFGSMLPLNSQWSESAQSFHEPKRENPLPSRSMPPLLCMRVPRISSLRRPTAEVADFSRRIRRFSIRSSRLLRLSCTALYGDRLSGRDQPRSIFECGQGRRQFGQTTGSRRRIGRITRQELRTNRSRDKCDYYAERRKCDCNRNNDNRPPAHRESNSSFDQMARQ